MGRHAKDWDEIEVEMKRVNIRITPEVYEWFKFKSARTGLPMSALMYLALEEHINQREVADTLPMLQAKLEDLARSSSVAGLDGAKTRWQAR